VLGDLAADPELRGLLEVDLIEGVSHAECLRRRARAHVFVDQLAPTIGGWGQSGIEAMAQGCAVLCDYHRVDSAVYATYPRPPILQVDDGDQLASAIRRLVSDREFLQASRLASVDWSRSNSSRDAVGRYWCRALGL